MLMRLKGKFIDFNKLQPSKAYEPISVTVSGSSIVVSLLQFLNT